MAHTNKADHPRERMTVVREPAQPEGIEPLQVLLRTDGRFIVRDPRRPLGDGTVWLGEKGEPLAVAQEVARAIAGGTSPMERR